MKYIHFSAFRNGKQSVLDCFKNHSLPGPGAYSPSVNLTKNQNPKLKFGTSVRRNPKHDDTPGPNAYKIFPVKTNPAYSFADKPFSSTRIRKPRPSTAITSCSPGPGKYNIRKDNISNTPSYKVGKPPKCKDTVTPCTPGPIHNTRNQSGESSPKYAFGTEPKCNDKRPITPAPGDNKQQKLTGTETPVFSFGKEERGVDSANPPQESKPHKLRTKTSLITEKSNFPGPGTYHPSYSNTKLRYPSCRIGTAKRRALYNSNINDPAPNKYDPNYLVKSNKPKSPSFTIGFAQRKLHSHQSFSPGPCAYNVTGNSTCGPKYTLRTKYKLRVNNDFPGPGQYELNRRSNWNKDPSWSIGTSQRGEELKKIIKENYPGPGMYSVNVNRDKVRGITIGKTKRKIYLKEQNNYPGPGQYRIPCEFDSVNEYTRQQGKFDENFRYV